MDTGALKKFAQAARRQLLEQVAARMEQVLQTDSVEIREKDKAVKDLQEQIKKSSKEAVIDQVAYTWFNRFCALRYMDVNHYTRIGIVSPVEGFTQPEILQEAKQGVIDDSFKVDKQIVVGLLNGQMPSSNPQQEVFQLLLVGACNAYHAQMPFLFPKIDDFTELLMPDDLLSENSVLQSVRDMLTPEACQDVEVIGWLYQYYISERKDEVFAALKKNKKIEAEDIPAATQLFTPHWIVRYLVENSLGRLWMLNHPDSRLVERMDYYIKPEEPETDYLEISSPEEIKVCDPACGSGHMLTYSFDLLYSIYEEEGYDAIKIPSLILQHNLYGIEIDKRAGHLAAFALMMKAREKDRRFFDRGVEPNVCVLENVSFTEDELDRYMYAVGRDIFTQDLQETLSQFKQANNFGSLIRPKVKDVGLIRESIEGQGVFDNLFLYETNQKVMKVLEQTEHLSSQYSVVVANPPYMGRGGMNVELRDYGKYVFPESKSDLFAMFIERGIELIHNNGYNSMVTMQSWMFLSSFEKLRIRLLEQNTLCCMVHMANMVMGIAFGTTAGVWKKGLLPEYIGHFSYVDYTDLSEGNMPFEFPVRNDRLSKITASEFGKIPGSPIAYWIAPGIISAFHSNPMLSHWADSAGRCKTHDNLRFIRYIWEVDRENIGIEKTWKMVSSGGEFRRWFGNRTDLINWSKEAREYYSKFGGLSNESNWNTSGITWSDFTSKINSFRIKLKDSENSSSGPTIVPFQNEDLHPILGYLNSICARVFISIINPTFHTNPGEVLDLPFIKQNDVRRIVAQLIKISMVDWESYEISGEFEKHPLRCEGYFHKSLENAYKNLRSHWRDVTYEMQELEEDNNRVFIKEFGLERELNPELPLMEITLTCNPHYRYRGDKTDEEREALLLADTMKEFISYAVGCMLGRYSLDKEGLVLANAGETLEDYLQQVPEPSFMPDEDNVIPVLEGEWFEDDIAERFKDFLKVTFGEENFEENIDFLEEAIGQDIRSYFVKDFYNHHVKMYKKRPIYWLFSSSKGSFNALIYMHRYEQDTLSVILNDYLVQYHEKMTAHKALLETRSISASASQGERTKALKEIDQINKVLSEIKEYEDEILYPLATQQIEIDLDDGVKVNYTKFGRALKKVVGLSVSE